MRTYHLFENFFYQERLLVYAFNKQFPPDVILMSRSLPPSPPKKGKQSGPHVVNFVAHPSISPTLFDQMKLRLDTHTKFDDRKDSRLFPRHQFC